MYLNLASHPLRNRRLFWGLLVILVGINLVFWGLSINTIFRYEAKIKGLNGVLLRLENRKKALQLEEKQIEKKIQAIQDRFAPQVEKINHLLARKGFSWESFFTDLESLIPERAYLVSLNPVLDQDLKQVSVRLKLASPTLGDLIDFTKKLVNHGCQEIKVFSEETEGGKNIVSEISFIYGATGEADN